MNNNELKQSIIDDIEFLKTAEIEIMDKKEYYQKLKYYGAIYFAWLYLPLLVFGLIFHSKQMLKRPLLEGSSWIIVDFLICLFMALAASGFIGKAIIFCEQLLPFLKTKKLIENEFRQFVKGFFAVYLSCNFIILAFAGEDIVCFGDFFFLIISFVFASIVVNFRLSREVDRIGAAVFFKYMSIFFEHKMSGFSSQIS
jgi:hypothetical protein